VLRALKRSGVGFAPKATSDESETQMSNVSHATKKMICMPPALRGEGLALLDISTSIVCPMPKAAGYNNCHLENGYL
jgi:hypothetical protein